MRSAPKALLHQQSEALEESMWYAVRTLIDKSKLSRQMAERAQERGHAQASRHFEEQARVAAQHAGVIRDLIESGDGQAKGMLEPSENARVSPYGCYRISNRNSHLSPYRTQ